MKSVETKVSPDTPLIGLIGAMSEEIVMIRRKLENVIAYRVAGLDFYRGQIEGSEVILAKCGVGKVNAALCAQLMVERYKVEQIIFTGVAGALDPSLMIGDIVISEDCMYHDMDATALGFASGEIPYASQSVFLADSTLVDFAEQAVEQQGKRSVRGRILSGDQFIADRSIVQRLYDQMSGTCTEMEGAAVAHVCSTYQLPFVVVRSISDKADGSATVNFAEFTVHAAEQSANVVLYMLELLRS